MSRELVAWIIVGLYSIGVLITIAQVGKPREPITPGIAAYLTVWSGLMAAAVLYAGGVI